MLNMPDYDKWKQTTPWDEAKIAFYCDECDEPIHIGEEYLELEGLSKVHEDCFDSFARDTLGARLANAEKDEDYGD